MNKFGKFTNDYLYWDVLATILFLIGIKEPCYTIAGAVIALIGNNKKQTWENENKKLNGCYMCKDGKQIEAITYLDENGVLNTTNSIYCPKCGRKL